MSCLRLLALLPFLCTCALANVVVSNHPLYLISRAVTGDAPAATKLLEAGDVGHHGALSPKDIKTIQDATYVVWFGQALESNLGAQLNDAPNAISLFEFDAFNRLPLRDVNASPIPNTFDPHIYLDVANARAIAAALAVIHSHDDPTRAEEYRANAKAFAKRLDEVTSQAGKTAPYWAYHDAFQYLEQEANLTLAGTLTTDHHLPVKASRFVDLNAKRPLPHMCLVAQSPISNGVKDKLGAIDSVVFVEDLSFAEDFVDAYQDIIQGIRACIRQ